MCEEISGLHLSETYAIILIIHPAGGGVMENLNSEQPKAAPGTVGSANKTKNFFSWVYRLRSILLAIPVLVASVVLAVINMGKLPEIVGLNMQSNGEYATAITRGVAVMGPFALTAICLLLMFCSKKVLYPWLISLFSLALPLLFLFTSTFP